MPSYGSGLGRSKWNRLDPFLFSVSSPPSLRLLSRAAPFVRLSFFSWSIGVVLISLQFSGDRIDQVVSTEQELKDEGAVERGVASSSCDELRPSSLPFRLPWFVLLLLVLPMDLDQSSDKPLQQD